MNETTTYCRHCLQVIEGDEVEDSWYIPDVNPNIDWHACCPGSKAHFDEMNWEQWLLLNKENNTPWQWTRHEPADTFLIWLIQGIQEDT